MKANKNMIPSFDEMFLPIVQALRELGGEASVSDLNQKALELMEVPQELQVLPHTDNGRDHRTEIEYRLAWARTYLKQFGLLCNPTRGMWQLTDAYSSGDTQEIVPSLIVKTVRQRRLDNFKENDEHLSPAEKARAFERFTLSALENYAQSIGKSLEIQPTYHDRWDAIMPQGIRGSDKKTYIEIKLSPNMRWSLPQLQTILQEIPADTQFLLIIGDVLSPQDKQSTATKLSATYQGQVLIWDYNDLITETNCELDSAHYLDEPKKALVEDVFRNIPSPEQRAQTRAARIERLAEQYQQENVTLLLGAGVSIAAGLPLWTTLIHQMLTTMICEKLNDIRPLTEAERAAISRLAEDNQESTPLTQVRYISSGMETDEFYQVMRKSLYGETVDYGASELLEAIAALSKPIRTHKGLKSIITYNFDDLLEQKLASKEIGYHSVSHEKDIPDPGVLNIYHVHGYLPQKEDSDLDPDIALVFSEEDYHELYRDVYSWSNLTQLSAFRESTCLFIGCSLEDPNLRRLLDVYRRSCDEPRHYAILKRKALEKTEDIKKHFPGRLNEYREIDNDIRDRYFESIGINVIWIDDYSEISSVLEEISNRRI